LPPYPCHASGAGYVRCPPPPNHLPPEGLPGRPLTTLPLTLTSRLRQRDVTPPFDLCRASTSPGPTHYSDYPATMAMPPEHPRHLGIRVTCHVIPSVLWAHHDVSMTSPHLSTSAVHPPHPAPRMTLTTPTPWPCHLSSHATWASASPATSSPPYFGPTMTSA